jgi:hypothetical protein
VPDVDGVMQVKVLSQIGEVVAVIAAARRLFAENGFFQTKVDQIAKLSYWQPPPSTNASMKNWVP